MSDIVLYAPGIHVGGGLVLLRELVASSDGRIIRYYVDARLRGRLEIPAGVACQYIAPGLPGRVMGEWQVARSMKNGEKLLCFHGLPPLFRQRARTIVYVQNRNLLRAPSGPSGTLVTTIKGAAKRWLFRVLGRNASEYIVQTESMKQALASITSTASVIRVFPFFGIPSAFTESASSKDAGSFDFVYVSDGEAHKNHQRLIDAWILLAEEGIRPSLCLTIPGRYPRLVKFVESASQRYQLAVTNLGSLSHEDVLNIYDRASALIFPSLSESLGLPLIEARMNSLPIVAAELDYVRDICEPVETFDPYSSRSIARAVKRFMGPQEKPPAIKSGRELLEALAG